MKIATLIARILLGLAFVGAGMLAGVTAFGLIFAAVGFGILIAMARGKKKPCPACGQTLQEKYRFCPKCAAPAA